MKAPESVHKKRKDRDVLSKTGECEATFIYWSRSDTEKSGTFDLRAGSALSGQNPKFSPAAQRGPCWHPAYQLYLSLPAASLCQAETTELTLLGIHSNRCSIHATTGPRLKSYRCRDHINRTDLTGWPDGCTCFPAQLRLNTCIFSTINQARPCCHFEDI